MIVTEYGNEKYKIIIEGLTTEGKGLTLRITGGDSPHVGAVAMAVLSVPVNYFISYPFYTSFMPLDTIIGMYQELLPSVDGLLACLLIFNMPFTLLKGVLDVALAFLIYKPLSPLLHK